MEENKLVNEEVVNKEESNAQAEEQLQEEIKQEKKKQKILIVEDEDISYEILATMLKDDYEILRASNGDEGLRVLRAKAKDISLVLLDILMPVMDGLEMLKVKVGERRIANIPVIVLTSEKAMEVEALRMGALDFIKKPFESQEVIKAKVFRIIDLYERHKLENGDPSDDIPAINIVDLYKSYGPKEVLKGLNLEVFKGELFGFIGRNGIGKSTTIDCMIGVKKFNSGRIEIEGYDITKEPLIAKSRFGYVASEPTCYETMTGYEYLEFIASVYQISEAEFASNVEYLTKRLTLTDEDLRKYIASYSHGMKQKLCLIASLLNNPDLWILDEPTVGLDIMAVEELKKMMREYANHDKCVFITSHNIDIIAKICDRVAIINDGKVVELMDLNRDPNKRLQLGRIFLNIFGANQ